CPRLSRHPRVLAVTGRGNAVRVRAVPVRTIEPHPAVELLLGAAVPAVSRSIPAHSAMGPPRRVRRPVLAASPLVRLSRLHDDSGGGAVCRLLGGGGRPVAVEIVAVGARVCFCLRQRGRPRARSSAVLRRLQDLGLHAFTRRTETPLTGSVELSVS